MGDSFWYKAQNRHDHRKGYGRSFSCKEHELDRESTDCSYLIYVGEKNEELRIAKMTSENRYQTFYQLKREMRGHHNLSRLIVSSLVDAYFLLKEIAR